MAKGETRESPMKSKEKSYVFGVILRLFILAATVAAILAVGFYRYGWRPMGPKIHADQVGRLNPAAEMPVQEKEPELADVLQDAMQPEAPAAAEPAAQEPETTTTTTPVPKPQITKDDQKALSDLLKKEMH
jgi:hypothetical protein